MFSDNSKKGSKGFYAALGISAVMIGSACFFAYNQNDKISDKKLEAESSVTSDSAVDKKSNDIPKITTAAATSHIVQTTTAAKLTNAPGTAATNTATIPAAAISTATPPTVTETVTASAAETASDRLANVSAPLADISNVINPFSGQELVKNVTTGSWQTHNGTDFAASKGDDVFVISAGQVTAVNTDPLWGVTVTVDHYNGYISKYCGLAADLSVQSGDNLVSGDTIGAVGDTADIESGLDPHLHIEVTHNGNYIDPASIFNS